MATPPRLIELPREYLTILMEAGYVYLAMRRLEEAKEVFEGVCFLAPKSEVPRMALGNVFSAEEKYDEALREYRKALKIEPQSALTYAHIGEVHLLLNEKSEAIEALNKAISLDTAGKAGEFARSLLDAVAKGILPLPKAPTPDIEK